MSQRENFFFKKKKKKKKTQHSARLKRKGLIYVCVRICTQLEAEKVMDSIRKQEVLAMIKARFGVVAFRIFSLLRVRPCLEQVGSR